MKKYKAMLWLWGLSFLENQTIKMCEKLMIYREDFDLTLESDSYIITIERKE